MSSHLKKNIIKIINSGKIKVSNKILIKELIYDGNLDKIINKIEIDSIISVLKSPLNVKGYLTSTEQFVIILDNFITYVINIVNSPELIKTIIINCLKNNSTVFLSKRYFYDTDNIEYYKYNFSSMITKIFYCNFLEMKDELLEELDIIKIDIDKIDINNDKDVYYLINIIDDLVFINKNDYKILALFTKISKSKYSIFVNQYKMLISKYKKNIKLINEYKKYKKNDKQTD